MAQLEETNLGKGGFCRTYKDATAGPCPVFGSYLPDLLARSRFFALDGRTWPADVADAEGRLGAAETRAGDRPGPTRKRWPRLLLRARVGGRPSRIEGLVVGGRRLFACRRGRAPVWEWRSGDVYRRRKFSPTSTAMFLGSGRPVASGGPHKPPTSFAGGCNRPIAGPAGRLERARRQFCAPCRNWIGGSGLQSLLGPEFRNRRPPEAVPELLGRSAGLLQTTDGAAPLSPQAGKSLHAQFENPSIPSWTATGVPDGR